MILRRAALAATTLALFAAAPTASATTQPGAEQELSVTASNGYRYSVDLTCAPRGGTHSDNWTACDAVRKSKGNMDNLPVQDWRVCTKELEPVVFSAFGHYHGETVTWEKAFPNECEGHRLTGGLFDF